MLRHYAQSLKTYGVWCPNGNKARSIANLRTQDYPAGMLRASKLPILPNGELIHDTYSIVRYLGGGAFGDVYLARHRYMGIQAMKVFGLDKKESALDEAFILAKLFHPSIVRMFEANTF